MATAVATATALTRERKVCREAHQVATKRRSMVGFGLVCRNRVRVRVALRFGSVRFGLTRAEPAKLGPLEKGYI